MSEQSSSLFPTDRIIKAVINCGNECQLFLKIFNFCFFEHTLPCWSKCQGYVGHALYMWFEQFNSFPWFCFVIAFSIFVEAKSVNPNPLDLVTELDFLSIHCFWIVLKCKRAGRFFIS